MMAAGQEQAGQRGKQPERWFQHGFLPIQPETKKRQPAAEGQTCEQTPLHPNGQNALRRRVFRPEQRRGQKVQEPTLVGVGRPFAVVDKHPVDVAAGQGPEKILSGLQAHAGAEPAGEDVRHIGSSMFAPARLALLFHPGNFSKR